MKWKAKWDFDLEERILNTWENGIDEILEIFTAVLSCLSENLGIFRSDVDNLIPDEVIVNCSPYTLYINSGNGEFFLYSFSNLCVIADRDSLFYCLFVKGELNECTENPLSLSIQATFDKNGNLLSVHKGSKEQAELIAPCVAGGNYMLTHFFENLSHRLDEWLLPLKGWVCGYRNVVVCAVEDGFFVFKIMGEFS